METSSPQQKYKTYEKNIPSRDKIFEKIKDIEIELMLYDYGIYDKIWFDKIDHESIAHSKCINKIKVNFRSLKIKIETNIKIPFSSCHIKNTTHLIH